MCEWARYPQQTVPTVYTARTGGNFYSVAAVPFDKCGHDCSTLRPVVTGWTWEAYRLAFPEVPPFISVQPFIGDGVAEVCFADAKESWRIFNALQAQPIDSAIAAVVESVRQLDRIVCSYFGNVEASQDAPLMLREYGADSVVPAFSEWGADSGTAYLWFIAKFAAQGGPQVQPPTFRAAAWVGWRKQPGIEGDYT